MTTHRVITRGESRQAAPKAARQPVRTQPLVPSAPDAERALIGSLLIEGASALAVDECARMVDHTSFLQPAWACAWRSIWRRAGSGEAIDPVLVAEDCERDEGWPAGLSALSALLGAADGATVVSHAPQYARQVADRAYQRRVIDTASVLAAKAYQHDGSQEDLAAAIAKEWAALDAVRAETETGELGPAFARLRERAASGVPLGIPTGMGCIDEWTGGVIRKRIWTVVGYSGVGKTWLACSIINGLVDAGARVGFASLEMTTDDLLIRMLAGRIGASSAYRFNQRPGAMPPSWTADELAAIDEAERRLTGGLRIFEDIRTLPAIESMARRNSFDALVVDYGQLIEIPNSRDGEYQDQTRVAQGLRALAKVADCTVIVLSQISEGASRMESGTPLSGKGTGAWRAVSDLMLSIRRDKDSASELILAANKNRFGPDESVGATARLYMDKATGVLREIALAPKPAPIRPYPAGEPVTHYADRESTRDTEGVW